MTIRRTAFTAATVVLATVALLLFARLAVRHVGESYFLADQVDQLQKYEAALRLEPEGLWGGEMSGTTARALGPFGALVFGLPVSLGLGIDAIHGFTALLLVIATAITFWQLTRLNVILAWGWLIVFTAMRMVWWSAAMFWVNTLLLPLGLIVLALFSAHLRQPSAAKLGGIALVLLLALQVNLVALAGLPILVIAAGLRLSIVGRTLLGPPGEPDKARPTRPASGKDSRTTLMLALSLIVLTLLPYFVAESKTNFRNTRAMFTHAESAVRSTGNAGRQAAADTLVLATDPMTLFSERASLGIAVGGSVALAALALVFRKRRRTDLPEERERADVMAWLVTAAIVGAVGQALFFLLMARPLNGLHYAILLAPWYAVPPAALLAAILPDSSRRAGSFASIGLGALAVLLLVIRGPVLADRSAERTAWKFSAIATALDTLCAGQAVQTLEGPGLVNELTPGYDSVLRYLMNRGFSRCKYDPTSDIVIAANRDASFDDMIDLEGRRFTRERVMPPGLARYRRVP